MIVARRAASSAELPLVHSKESGFVHVGLSPKLTTFRAGKSKSPVALSLDRMLMILSYYTLFIFIDIDPLGGLSYLVS